MTEGFKSHSRASEEAQSDAFKTAAPSLPIPIPTGSSTDPPQLQVGDQSSRSTPRKTASQSRRSPAADGTRRTISTRVGRRQLDQLAARLSERDIAVVAAVQRHRFLATSQAERLLFTEHASPLSAARTARRVIRRLADGGLIRHLERRVGGMASGSTEHVWMVTEAGHRLLTREFGRAGVQAGAISGDTRRHRFHQPSERLLVHCLAITEAALALIELGRARAQIEDVSLELEPASWRRYDGLGGGSQLIRPDMAAVTVMSDNDGQAYEDHWFLEVDLGNEHLPTLLDKCRQYLAYRRTGVEQDRHEVFPIVVWIMHTAERRDDLETAVATAKDLDGRLFRIVTLDQLGALVIGGAA